MVPLDGERCFNSLEHKHLYNCPWFLASLRLSSSSNHDPFGYTQVSAHADSRAWPQARSGRRVPGDFSHAMLWAWPPSGSRGDTPHFFRVLHIRFCFPHVSEAHLANWDIILGQWVQKKKKSKDRKKFFFGGYGLWPSCSAGSNGALAFSVVRWNKANGKEVSPE